MPSLQLTIPAQDGRRADVKVKPREVRAWLDNLPFLDLPRSARLARQQLRLLNRQALACGARLEILGSFLTTYQRLAEQVEGRGHSTDKTRDGDTLQSQVRHLCQDIGFGYKIVVHDLIHKTSSFMETRNLPLALLGAIHTLGLQLFDCYTSYRPAPRALWSECLSIYAYAWQNGRETYAAELPGFGLQQIDTRFRLIALLRLADPYRLSAGMAPALRDYLSRHSSLCRIYGEPPDEGNHFQLMHAFMQTPDDTDAHLYLEMGALLSRMAADIETLTQRGRPGAIGLPAEVPVLPLLRCLRQTFDHWRDHPTRSTEREAAHTRIDLVGGLSAVYYVLNHGRHFDAALCASPGEENCIDLGARPATDNRDHLLNPPPTFACTSTNRSRGGLAVRYRGTQTPHPRVGQLVALRRPAAPSRAGWVVAVCRWLLTSENDAGVEFGLQYLAREPRAVVIRAANDATATANAYQAAISAIQKRGQETVHTLITASGAVPLGSELNLFEQGRRLRIRCTEQLEAGPGFDRYLYHKV